MKIDTVSDGHSINIRFFPFHKIGTSTFDCNTAVTVHQTMTFMVPSTWGEAKVNWPALGASTPARAKLFSEAIALAAAEAEKLNERKGKTQNEH